MDKIKIFFINKNTLELKKDELKIRDWGKFPKDLCDGKINYPYTIKLKKDGSLMQTGDTGFYIFTEKQREEMLNFINYLLTERREQENQLKFFKYMIARRF